MTAIREFSRKHIYIFSILFSVVATLLLGISGSIIFKLLGHTSINIVLSYLPVMLFVFSITYILAIGKQIGFHKKNIGKGILLGWLSILYGMINLINGLLTTESLDLTLFISPEIVYFTLHMFFIGLYEELLCRGVLLNIMINKWGHIKKSILKSVILSSVIFGSLHFLNLLNLLVSPNPELIVDTLSQVIYATFVGIYFACVYLRCKNIWPVIIFHALFDWCTLLFEKFSTASTANVMYNFPIPPALLNVLIALPLALAGLFLLRKVKPEDNISDNLHRETQPQKSYYHNG